MSIAAMNISGWLLLICFGCVCSEYCHLCKTTDCSKCTVGWFGENCESFCSEKCFDGCNKTGWCRDCKPNYFGGECGERCPENCRPSDKKEITCDQIAAKCLSGCNEGFWGPTCIHSCPSCCVGNVCRQTTGECTMGCNDDLVWNKSKRKCKGSLFLPLRAEDRTCRDGFYGRDCDLPCSPACKESSCEFKPSQNSLVCKRGCIDGRTGPYCEQRCPRGCLRCSETDWCETPPSTGCQYACTTPACSSCFDGYYGLICEKRCPENCKDVCHKSTGSCNHACKDGFWNPYCNLTCPQNCRGSTCEQSTGKCTGGCQPGWYGVNCIKTCRKDCLPNILECTMGYSGERCNERCAGKCKTCDRQHSSHCTKCTCRTYGPNCDNKCSSGCLDTVCPVCSSQGVCLAGCIEGRWGDHCEHEECDKQRGQCKTESSWNVRYLPLGIAVLAAVIGFVYILSGWFIILHLSTINGLQPQIHP